MTYLEYFKNLSPNIRYDNDHEYRNAIRKIFRFDPNEIYTYNQQLSCFDQLDDLTKDEVLFDSKQSAKCMEELYTWTKDCKHFHTLYLKAAATMFSTSPEIGQTILCSYSTFDKYYSCLWLYLHNNDDCLLSCQEYQYLQSYYGDK